MLNGRFTLSTIGVALLLLFAGASGVSASDISAPTAPQLALLKHQIEINRPAFSPSEEAAACSLKNHVPTALAYYSGIQTGFRFASYMNPVNCAGTEDYPYGIYFVSFPLFHFEGAEWPLGLNLEIWSATTDSCEGPQTKLFSKHYFVDSSSFAAPKVGVLRLDDPVCVDGPFFVSVQYDGSTAGPYPSVLLDTVVPPVQCVNWGYRNDQWMDWPTFWTSPVAGNFMVWVDGYTNSNFCATTEDTVRTIEGLHTQLDSLAGRRVSVVGYYSDNAEGRLFSFYPDYLGNSPLPPRTDALLIGPQPHDSFAGALVRATGYLQADPDPHPISPLDSVELSLYVTQCEKIIDPPPYPETSGDTTFYFPDPDICQSYRVAMLLGGGPNAANDHRRYWTELVMGYNSLHVPNYYCPENVIVFYGDGISKDPAAIPQSAMRTYSETVVDSVVDALSRVSADRVRIGQGGIQLQILISGQSSSTGLMTVGGAVISPGELHTWLQQLLDSSASVNLDITTSYGGVFAEALLSLEAQSYRRLHVSTAAGNGRAWSAANCSPFLQTYRDTLQNNWTLSAYAAALNSSEDLADSLRTAFVALNNAARTWLLAHAPGTVNDSVRAKIVNDTLALNSRAAEIAAMLADVDGRPWLWERDLSSAYGTWRTFVIPEHGQATFEFVGDTSVSGSVTVYEDTVAGGDNTLIKRAVWNWNIPGSAEYTFGDSARHFPGRQNEKSVLWVHPDEAPFTYTAILRTSQPEPFSNSDSYDLPGFSVAGVGYGHDFMSVSPASIDTAPNSELPGLVLNSVPAKWGTCGCTELVSQFTVPLISSYHADMEVRVVVYQVQAPGSIQITIPGAATPFGSIPVSSAGVYRFDCGAFAGTGPQELKFTVTTGCFIVDAFSLRSTVIDPPSCCQGTTGNINAVGSIDISDLSLLISYLVAGNSSLPCMAEANVNALGSVDISDLSMLIAYLVSGGVTLPPCP
ncbi:MAG: hypothetical protein NDJ18_09120 [candidate division Zixibacteria bacterium]|nr:hypothetical protein [candidate division Zixibacteria bacterium]